MRKELIMVVAVALGSGCGDLAADCSNTIKAEIASPTGRSVATVFERDCGAPTDYSTSISLRDARDPFDPDQSSARVFTATGQPVIVAKWVGDDTITIDLPDAPVFRKLQTWRDIKINYR